MLSRDVMIIHLIAGQIQKTKLNESVFLKPYENYSGNKKS